MKAPSQRPFKAAAAVIHRSLLVGSEATSEALRLTAVGELEKARENIERAEPFQEHVETAISNLREASQVDPLDSETDALLFRALELDASTAAQADNLVRMLDWFNPLDGRLDFGGLEAGLGEGIGTIESGIRDVGTRATGLLGRLNEFDLKSLNQLNELIRVDPRNCDHLLRRGEILERQEQWQEAARDYRAAVDVCEDPSLAHAMLASLLLNAGDPDVRNLDQAERFARYALDARPNDSQVVDLMLRCYRSTGRMDEARRFFASFLDEHPGHEAESRIRAELEIDE